MRCKLLFISSFFLLLPIIIFAQNKKKLSGKTQTDTGMISRFNAYIQNALPLWKTPGISVVVVKDGKVVFKKAFGVSELGKPEAFTTSTLSICASTTKAMTAVCMAMLVDEGKIKWSDKVSDIYPPLKLYDNYASSEITIKDLFTHNTGLGNADWLWSLGFDLDEIIRRMRFIKPSYSFRSSFIYQNLMYMLAGEVIHKVSGKPWDEYIQEHLFIPLGMEHSYPSYPVSLKETDRITPHFTFTDSIVKPIPYIETKGIDAAGGVWSCADDIGKWMMFMLDSCKVKGVRLLKANTYNELFKPQVIIPGDEFYPTAKFTHPHWTTYGLGWFQQDYRGKMIQFHTGSLDGAVAIIGLIPDEHFGIYIFGNLDHSEIRHALMYKAMDLWVFGDDSNDWSKNFYDLYSHLHQESKMQEADFGAKRTMNTHPSLPLKEYAGTYSSEIFGDAEIALNKDSLLLKFPQNISLQLSHWHYDVFSGKYNYEWWSKSWITFSINSEGKVMQFDMDGIVYRKKD